MLVVERGPLGPIWALTTWMTMSEPAGKSWGMSFAW